MPAPDLFALFLEPLERLALPYCITSSVAASVYGEPRLTADIDVVLLLTSKDLPALQSAFPESDYYVPSAETLREEVAREAKGMFNLIAFCVALQIRTVQARRAASRRSQDHIESV